MLKGVYEGDLCNIPVVDLSTTGWLTLYSFVQ